MAVPFRHRPRKPSHRDASGCEGDATLSSTRPPRHTAHGWTRVPSDSARWGCLNQPSSTHTPTCVLSGYNVFFRSCRSVSHNGAGVIYSRVNCASPAVQYPSTLHQTNFCVKVWVHLFKIHLNGHHCAAALSLQSIPSGDNLPGPTNRWCQSLSQIISRNALNSVCKGRTHAPNTHTHLIDLHVDRCTGYTTAVSVLQTRRPLSI